MTEFEELVRPHADALYRTALRMTGDASLVKRISCALSINCSIGVFMFVKFFQFLNTAMDANRDHVFCLSYNFCDVTQ